MNTDTQNGELLGTGPFRGMTLPIPNREIITDGDITADPACGILLVMSRNPKKVSIVRTDTCSHAPAAMPVLFVIAMRRLLASQV
jgi:hypothetical protein